MSLNTSSTEGFYFPAIPEKNVKAQSIYYIDSIRVPLSTLVNKFRF
jgi:hypothetical protein